MTATDPDEYARRLARTSLSADDPMGWFERLYADAAGGSAVVPWDRGGPHVAVIEWVHDRVPSGEGRRAVVVGAGLGEDAELISKLGFDTVAFDVSETAIRTARERFPASTVRYLTADLFNLPEEWLHAFDLVVESQTVQALPPHLREAATAGVTRLVAAGGTLLVIAAAFDEDNPYEGPPWPLTRAHVEAFARDELEPVRIEHLPPGRWRAEFRRRVVR